METIKENHLFKRAYNRGKKQMSASLVIYYFPNKSSNRFGITVSKKIGKAVVRNHIRRLIRESIRIYEPDLKEGYDIVFVARSASAGASFAKLSDSVYDLLRKADLFEKV